MLDTRLRRLDRGSGVAFRRGRPGGRAGTRKFVGVMIPVPARSAPNPITLYKRSAFPNGAMWHLLGRRSGREGFILGFVKKINWKITDVIIVLILIILIATR